MRAGEDLGIRGIYLKEGTSVAFWNACDSLGWYEGGPPDYTYWEMPTNAEIWNGLLTFDLCIAELDGGAALEAQRELLFEQVHVLCAAWRKRDELKTAHDQAFADAQRFVRFGEYVGDEPVLAAAGDAFRRAELAVNRLEGQIHEVFDSLFTAVKAQQEARNTTEALYRRAVAASLVTVGGQSDADEIVAAEQGVAQAAQMCAWNNELTETARELYDAANQLGQHPTLAGS
jgi:hypothetical protein